MVIACSIGSTHGDGEPLPQRAAGRLHARRAVFLGMSLQARAELAQRQQLFLRNETSVGQQSVQQGNDMPLGPEDAITVRVGRTGQVGLAEVKGCHDVGRRQGAARMSGACCRDGAQDVLAHLRRQVLQRSNAIFLFHGTYLSSASAVRIRSMARAMFSREVAKEKRR